SFRGAPTGPRKARPDDRLRCEPGIPNHAGTMDVRACAGRNVQRRINTREPPEALRTHRLHFSNSQIVRSQSFAISRRDAPELSMKFSPAEGVGNAGCPRTRSLVCKGRKHTSVVTTSTPETPGIPARGWF